MARPQPHPRPRHHRYSTQRRSPNVILPLPCPWRHRPLVGVDTPVRQQIHLRVEQLSIQLFTRQAPPASFTEDTQHRVGVLHFAYLPVLVCPITWSRWVGHRRGFRWCESFSGGPPPNDACDFHRTSLSSATLRDSYRDDNPLWMPSWQARQTIRVLRRRAAISLAHSGCSTRLPVGRSCRRRTWCASTSACAWQNSHRPAMSRPTSSAGRFLQMTGSSSVRTTGVVLRAKETPPHRATSGLFPPQRSTIT